MYNGCGPRTIEDASIGGHYGTVYGVLLDVSTGQDYIRYIQWVQLEDYVECVNWVKMHDYVVCFYRRKECETKLKEIRGDWQKHSTVGVMTVAWTQTPDRI